MKLTPRQLIQIGISLYGENWKTALANLMCVSDRTMRRYAKSGMTLSDKQAINLSMALGKRVDDLTYHLHFVRARMP